MKLILKIALSTTITFFSYQHLNAQSLPGENISNNNLERITDCTPPSISGAGQPLVTQSVCKGSSPSSLSVLATGDGLTYQWYADNNNLGYNGNLLVNETTSSFTPPSNVVGSVCYYVKVTGSCGVANSNYSKVHTNPPPLPVSMTPTESTICIGGNTILNASSAIDYNWSVGSGNVSNVTTTPYRGYFGGSKSQFLYTKDELIALGMTPGTPINKLSLNVSSFSGPFTFNSFRISMKNTSSTSLTTTMETGATTVFGPTNYTIPAQGSPFTLTHDLSTEFLWDGASNILVEFCFNNNNGGAAPGNSANVVSTTVTGRANYFSADNNANVCSNGTGLPSSSRVNITFGYSAIPTINWSPATGLNTTSGNTVLATPSETTIYTAALSNSFGCSSSSISTINVSHSLVVAAEISGPLNACSHLGNSSELATYTIAADNASAINWTIPAGALNVSGQGTNSISFNYPMNFIGGTISVLVSPMAPCSPAVNRSLAISKSTPAAPVVSGIINVCNYVGTGEELIYTAAADENVTSYLWTVGSMVTIVGNNSSNSLQIKLQPGFLTSASSKQLRVVGLSACGSSSMAIFYLSAQLPQTAGQISGPTEICSYVGSVDEATYQIDDVISATSYLWTVPAGATIVGNSTGTSINVSYGNASTSGNVSVRAVNSCGTSSARSLPIKRTSPSMPGLISGPKNICMLLPSIANPAGLFGVYSIPRTPNVNYIWNVPSGIVIESHTNTISEDIITVSYNNSYSGGSIGVSAEGQCGTSAERILNLVQLPTGAVGGIIQLSAGTCKDRTYVYAVAAMPTNSTSLEWTVPVGAEIVGGQGTTTIAVLFPNDAISGIISAVANNGCGSGLRARTLPVKLSGCAPQEPMVKGDVKVVPTQEYISDKLEVKVYPNPSTTQFSLQVKSDRKERINMRIVNILGSKVSSREVMPNEIIRFGNDLKKGLYYVEIVQGTKKKIIKIIKQ